MTLEPWISQSSRDFGPKKASCQTDIAGSLRQFNAEAASV
jgi:hypothetical protein